MKQRQEKVVLFLCTGNYYRSRFAEILFNSVAGKMGLPWKASSRGLALERGINNLGPIAKSALDSLKRMGIIAESECARFPAAVTDEDFEKAARIIALKETEHRPLLEDRFPAWTEKVEFWHINDAPEALSLIEREVMDLMARLLGGTRQPAPTEEPIHPQPSKPEKPLTAKVGRETAGRRGKGVTTVFDLPLDEAALMKLAATLKQRCGTGGTVKDGRIEIQGDQRARVIVELEKLGYKVKKVGG